MAMTKEVLVIGAGWAGLRAAQTLVEAGFNVRILEKSNHVGGRISTDYVDGFTLDH